jgi:hypothetical protein
MQKVDIGVMAVEGKTTSFTVSATASSSTSLPRRGSYLRLVNEGPSVAFVSVGSGAQVATLPSATPSETSTPVLAGEDVVFAIPNNSQTPLEISAICRSGGTATIDAQVGGGI